MKTPKPPLSVKLIMAVFTPQSELFPKVERQLEKKWGEIDFKGPLFDFDHTDYYQEEMGFNLKKKFICFKDLMSPEDIDSIKISTNELEKKYSVEDKRLVNIDPGYISNSKLILASTKDYYHRIYLGNGIYAEVTLFFQKGSFQPLPWTYPDYKTNASLNIFNRIREIYRKQLANL